MIRSLICWVGISCVAGGLAAYDWRLALIVVGALLFSLSIYGTIRSNT